MGKGQTLRALSRTNVLVVAGGGAGGYDGTGSDQPGGGGEHSPDWWTPAHGKGGSGIVIVRYPYLVPAGAVLVVR